MCGIAGKVSSDGTVDRPLLDRMCEMIVHRGPDSRGVFTGEGAGLGVQRLAVIDLENGNQPISNEDGTVVVVLNGEIYNYRELRVDLQRSGHRFVTNTDTEVLVHLYEDLGAELVHRLRGMFAFALWDRRRRRLFIARDRLGKKPLFYSHRDGTLWFASEAKSILQDPLVPRDVNHDAVDAYLHFGYVPDPLSIFAALHKLPPGHVLTWQDGDIALRRYWRLSYTPKAQFISPADAHEAIRESLLEATRLRLRSDVPLGAFLSGGVDSTAVVAAMVRESTERVRTFTVGFDVADFDESAQAREVSEFLGTEHLELRLEADAVDVLPTLVWQYGEPFADHSAIPSLYLAREARRHVTVALNGDGGDESFAGYGHYQAGLIAQRLSTLPPTAGRALQTAARVLGGDPPRFAAARRAGWLGRAMTLDQPGTATLMAAHFTESDRHDLYTPDFRRHLEGLGQLTAPMVVARAMAGSDAPTTLERFLDADVNTYLPSDLLVKMDIASMTHSLEVRSPLLDHVFMELAASLPANFKSKGGRTKIGLRDAVRPWLPDHVLDRPKRGFSVPLAEWLRGQLRSLPSNVLLDRQAVDRGLFETSTVQRLIDEHLSRRADHSRKLWALVQLELWFRMYIDSDVPQPPALSVG